MPKTWSNIVSYTWIKKYFYCQLVITKLVECDSDVKMKGYNTFILLLTFSAYKVSQNKSKIMVLYLYSSARSALTDWTIIGLIMNILNILEQIIDSIVFRNEKQVSSL